MMESEVSNWNDDRLDELNQRVGEGFAKVDERFVRLEGEMKEGFARVDQRFEQVEKRFEQVDKRFEQVDKRFEQVDKRFEQVATREDLAEMRLASREEIGEVKTELRSLNERFDRLYYTLLVVMIGLVGSLFAKGGL